MLKRFFVSMLGSLAAIWISFMLLFVMGMLFTISAIIGSISGGSSSVALQDKSVLCLRLDNAVEERASHPNIYDIINEKPKTQSLADIVNAIKASKDDSKIEGLYIDCRGAGMGIATREAIRNAVSDFKTSGKWTIAYGDSYTQGDYYIASAADEIVVNPVGMLDIRGMASYMPYFKGLLDKVGVEMQIVRVGTFKSAVEPYTQTEMSEANRLQTTAFLDNIWGNMAKSIADARGLKVERINEIADSMMTIAAAENLVDLKLVDSLKYRDEVADEMKTRTGVGSDSDLRLVTVSEYIASGAKMPHSSSSPNKIAVYYAYGDITENGDNGIASERVVPDILELANDDDIEAMVLRVNSGGGSAFASEQIWHALEVFKSKGKMLYVSMGDYAASGGYYISCGADRIFAQPLTLTGSIGIFGMIPCAKELLANKLGINMQSVSTNANSVGPTVFEPMTPFQRNVMQNEVNRGYELFTKRCADGRDIPQDSIKAIAEGRVWDGVKAHEIGLVDELGTLDDAIVALAKVKQYDEYQVVCYPNPEASFWDVIVNFNTQMRADALKAELGQYYPVYEQVKNISEMDPIQARMESVVFN